MLMSNKCGVRQTVREVKKIKILGDKWTKAHSND